MEENTMENTVVQTNKKKKKIITLCLSIFVAVLICGYVVTAFYFAEHFYPGTVINGLSFDNADSIAVVTNLVTQTNTYQIQVRGRDLQTFEDSEICIITAEDINLVNSIETETVEALLKTQESWLWPVYIWGTHSYSLQGEIVYDEEKLEAILGAQDAFQENKMTVPKDAYIEGYSEQQQCFTIVPEVVGSELYTVKAREFVGEAIKRAESSVSLEEGNCYLQPSTTADSDVLQQKLSGINKWLETRITYDWNGNEVVLAKEQIKDWIILENGVASLDEDAIAAFVKENAGSYDTYGKPRTVHTTLGYDLNLPGRPFGWLTDQEAEVQALAELIKTGTVGEREPEYASTAPWKGENDIGDSYVEVDLTHQHLYLYQNGEIVVESDFVSGNMSNGNATPQGVFGLTYKTTNAVLRGADYETPVNYWMPFYGNYGLHDATWRRVFGGDIYLTSGSHGCVNLPLDKAAEIYQYLSTGFPVICYYYPPGVLTAPEIPQEQEIPQGQDVPQEPEVPQEPAIPQEPEVPQEQQITE